MKNDVVLEAKTRKYHLRYRDSLTWAAKANRRKETESEKIIWNKVLRKKKLGVKFSRQKPIGRFIADFYCSELHLIIEVDGGSHNDKRDRDKLRDKYLASCGINTLRFSDEDVLNNTNYVEKQIREYIEGSPVKGSSLKG